MMVILAHSMFAKTVFANIQLLQMALLATMATFAHKVTSALVAFVLVATGSYAMLMTHVEILEHVTQLLGHVLQEFLRKGKLAMTEIRAPLTTPVVVAPVLVTQRFANP
ncbi:MAG: hypothetical protein BWX66_01967 [Deltaproteobacteria bacterium ADurb.Bin058]|nr:MAG: hypothetical protein BWX66_01967 [Deltaproteobacteria bacterium ADurb.Bin058]